MATKKQKREAAMAKREKFEQETKASGLMAQQLDREIEKVRQERVAQYVKDINSRYAEILKKGGIN